MYIGESGFASSDISLHWQFIRRIRRD